MSVVVIILLRRIEMRVFVLEDNEDRARWFIKNYVKDDLTLVNDAATDAHLVSIIRYDLIFLDHDLNGEVYCPSDEHSGYAVAQAIVDSPNQKTPVIIHSWNDEGASMMLMFCVLGVWT